MISSGKHKSVGGVRYCHFVTVEIGTESDF